MAFETIPGTTTQYALISFDADGRERTDDPQGIGGVLSKEVLARAAREQPTNVFLFSHGWKGDVGEARNQYNSWLKAMLDLEADRKAMGPAFKPMWIGLHWPSLPFGDEGLGGASFDVAGEGASPERLVERFRDQLGLGAEAEPLLRTIVDAHRADATASELPPAVATAYVQLATLAGYGADGPAGAPDADGAAYDPNVVFQAGNELDAGVDFGNGGLLSGIIGPLQQLSYWTMKKRARTIGESGMHQFVAAMMTALPAAKFHLMGHSFGCIVMSSVVGGSKASGRLPRQVDSLVLIQGAVSLWAFGEQVHGQPKAGYFHPWVQRGAVRGPVVVSHSVHDKAVGTLYPWASAVSLNDGSFDADELPLYGAIGKWGIRGLTGVVSRPMLEKSEPYAFQAGKVYNLESSKFIAKGEGLSGAHSDISGPQVAHALWQAALV